MYSKSLILFYHAMNKLQFRPTPSTNRLLPVPHPCNLRMPHLLLQLEHTIHERLSCWRTSRNVNINWNNSITSSCNTVTVVVISTTIRTTSHRNHPSWIRHLVVHLTQRRSHFIRQCACDNHHVRLTWRRTENYTESVLIVSWCGKVHHFDGAAGQSERHWP